MKMDATQDNLLDQQNAQQSAVGVETVVEVAADTTVSLGDAVSGPSSLHYDTKPAAVHAQAGLTPAFLTPAATSRWYDILKRSIDIAGSLLLIFLLAPVLFVSWVILALSPSGQPLFRQTRVGRGGKEFDMYKFRSMVPNAGELQHLVENEQEGPIFKNKSDPRITAFGRFLRSTSIDEMPQLFNVLWGDMSLVGPRPPVPQEVAEYEPWQHYRLAVTPGLTCLWQVSGRSEIGFDDWMRMDLWYVNYRNIYVDLVFLLRTPWCVLRCRGAY
ncbi:MAG: sugar transferase [Planctomycetales bacterium]|nr:sugar transferase [Planctomycetales bacterium]